MGRGQAIEPGLPTYYPDSEAEPPLSAGVFTSIARPRDYDYHHGFEFGVALRGARERMLPGFSEIVDEGDVWLCCAWELHGYRVLTEDTESVVVIFEAEVLGEERLAGVPWVSLFAAPPHLRPRVRTEALRARVLGIAGEMRDELLPKRLGWEEVVRLHLLRILLALRREWEPPPSDAPPAPTPVTDLMRIMPALEALQRDPQLHLGLERAGALCGLSASRFGVLFRRAMGSSFGRYAQTTRLSQAAQRLLSTDLSIEAIAEQLGFTDGSHLHHLFLKQYGLTPTAYRRRGQ